MSDAMKYEDWLRGCVRHDGRKGNVYLPCDIVLGIADWIEAHRDAVSVVRCKDCKWYQDNATWEDFIDHCKWISTETPDENDFCSCGERKDHE